MKAFVFAALAALTMVAAPASAKDFTGPRIGVQTGYDDVASHSGVSYGVVAGVDAPVIKGVTVGVEATLEDSTVKGLSTNVSRDIGLNLRAGLQVLPRAQVFAKVGYANTRFENAGGGLKVSAEGVRYGAGVEYALTDHLYATAEYRRTQLENAAGAFKGRDGALVGFGLRF